MPDDSDLRPIAATLAAAIVQTRHIRSPEEAVDFYRQTLAELKK